jgi:hemerythrin
MSLLTWDETLSVDIDIIDEQHKKLIGMINDLHEAMKERRGHEILSEILDRMVEYTHFHFDTEEKYFDLFHYEHAIEHKRQHHGFVDKVDQFKKDFEQNNADVSIAIMNFLKDWTVHHIQIADKQYVQCFHEHGLE